MTLPRGDGNDSRCEGRMKARHILAIDTYGASGPPSWGEANEDESLPTHHLFTEGFVLYAN